MGPFHDSWLCTLPLIYLTFPTMIACADSANPVRGDFFTAPETRGHMSSASNGGTPLTSEPGRVPVAGSTPASTPKVLPGAVGS